MKNIKSFEDFVNESLNEARTKADLEDSLKNLESQLRKWSGVRQNSIHPFDPQKKVKDYVDYLQDGIRYVKAELAATNENVKDKHILEFDDFSRHESSLNESSSPAILNTSEDIQAAAATVVAPKGVDFQTSIIDRSSSYYTPKWAGKVRIQAWVEDPKFETNHTYWIYVSADDGRFYSDLDAVVQAPVLNGSDLNFKGDAKNFKSGLKEWLSACVRLSKSKEKDRKQKQSKWQY